jgi:hypothetical protein
MHLMNSTYRFGTIRTVWQTVFGDDVSVGRRSAPDQYKVVCPFHDDHSPSCDVNLAKNTFYCRSCEAQGGLLDVVVLARNAPNRSQAIDWLKQHGVVL